MSGFEEHILNAIRKLEKKDKEREKLLQISREILRKARQIVLNIQSGNIKKSSEIINKIIKEKNDLDFFKINNPDLYYSGTVVGALTEYVESLQLYNFLTKKRILSLEELNVEPAPYLLGLADLVGELRRITIEKIKSNNFEEAERIFLVMEKIYHLLRTTILPEALIPGLRRKTDIIRNVVENTRKDILYYKKSFILSKKLEEVAKKLEI